MVDEGKEWLNLSREKIKASTAERRWMENPVLPSSCVTPAGTSIGVQNEWEENTHTKRTQSYAWPEILLPDRLTRGRVLCEELSSTRGPACGFYT